MLALLRFARRLRLAFFESSYPSFSFRNFQTYIPAFKWLGISFVFAFVFVLPFYAQWFLQSIDSGDMPLLLGSILALLSLGVVLYVPKERRLSFGFFVGVLWFYWIGLGLRYFDLFFLIPFVVLAIGWFLAIVFYVGLFCECFVGRFVFLLALSYFTPLGFDWLVPESLLAYSYFGVDKLSFAFVLLALWGVVELKKWSKILILPLLFFAFEVPSSESIAQLPKIKLVQSHIPQDFQWRFAHMSDVFNQYLEVEIPQAIEQGYDVVVLPESALYASVDFENLRERLLVLSQDIVIITGALRMDENQAQAKYFNTAYIFSQGRESFVDKVRLVPFGEYIPPFLLSFAQMFVPDIESFTAGDKYEYFEIDGMRFKNAICYEGTSKEFYSDSPQYVMMISNNAWFVPSLEPVLQKNLLKYYARLHKSVIFHASNLSPGAIILPE